MQFKLLKSKRFHLVLSALFALPLSLLSPLGLNGAHAEQPGKLLYGNGSFKVAKYDASAILEKLAAEIPNKEDGYRALLIALPTSQQVVQYYAYNIAQTQKMNEVDTVAFITKAVKDFPLLVKRRIKACTTSSGGTSSVDADKVTTVALPKAMAFWTCFLGTELVNSSGVAQPDLVGQAAALAWSRHNFPRLKNADSVERLMTRLLDPFQAPLVSAFKASWLDLDTRTLLAKNLEARGYRIFKKDDLVLIGSGPAYFLLVDLISKFDDSNRDQVLSKRLARVVRMMQSEGIPVVQEDLNGAVAFYSPLYDYVSFSIPHGTDANTYTHEMTHARFRRFESALQDWTDAKDYAIPYEIDGPNGGFLFWDYWFGGFMNLLNELNSWRTGESFDGGQTDKEIYKILIEGYGRQAGEEAIKLFEQVWPLSRVEGVSVPKLILRTVRELNALTEAELILKAEKASTDGDVVSMFNVMRLIDKRYSAENLPPEGLTNALIAWAAVGPNDEIKGQASVLVAHYFPQTVDEDMVEWQAILENTSEYFAPYAIQGALPRVFPMPVLLMLYMIEAENIPLDAKSGETAFDALVKIVEFEPFPKTALPTIQKILDIVIKVPGTTVREKLDAFFTDYKATPFADLWDRFQKINDPYDFYLLMARHLPALTSTHYETLVEQLLAEGGGQKSVMAQYLIVAGIQAVTKQAAESGQKLADPLPWSTAKIDELLTAYYFSDTVKGSKEAIGSLLAQLYKPRTLPKFTQALANLALDPNANPGDLRRLNIFFNTFSDEQPKQMLENQSEWANLILDAILQKPNTDMKPKPGRALLIAEYFRSIQGHILGLKPWGSNPATRLNAEYRDELQIFELGLPEDRKALLHKWNQRLWDTLSLESGTIREAAIYAIARHPLNLILLESQILKALNSPSTLRNTRAALLKLIVITEKGFLPKIDIWLEKTDANAFSPLERRMLKLRRGFVEGCNDFLI